MKFWTSDSIFKHPWETVTQAVWRKYPNDLNPNVVGVDIVDRNIDKNGVLKTHRILTTSVPMIPQWVCRWIGMNDTCYVTEHSELDPKSKTFTIHSRNLTLCDNINVIENITYTQHPEHADQTVMKQDSTILIKGVPLTEYLETQVVNTCSANASKGRQAIEGVIEKIKSETSELRKFAQAQMDNMPDLSPRVAHCQASNEPTRNAQGAATS